MQFWFLDGGCQGRKDEKKKKRTGSPDSRGRDASGRPAEGGLKIPLTCGKASSTNLQDYLLQKGRGSDQKNQSSSTFALEI